MTIVPARAPLGTDDRRLPYWFFRRTMGIRSLGPDGSQLGYFSTFDIMRLISYASDSGPRIAAVAESDTCVDLNEADPDLPSGMCKFLALGRDGLRRAAAALETGKRFARDKVRLLPPVPRP